MASCDILDFKCIYMNEIMGSVGLAVIGVVILYFIAASKMRLGFDATIAFFFPFVIIGGMMVAGFSIIFAFVTMIVGLMLAWIINIIIKNN